MVLVSQTCHGETSGDITELSTLPNNLGDSRFWTISPGLQVRVRNVVNNRESLPFVQWTRLSDNTLSTILCCLGYFNVNIERFVINSGMPL